MAKTKFTFRNYLKALKEAWLVLVIFLVLGAGAGAFVAFKKPVMYTSATKIAVYNSTIDNGAVTSPYTQIAEYLASKKLLAEVDDAIELADIPAYTVVEAPRGIFTITVTANDAETAKKFAGIINNNAMGILSSVLGNTDSYRLTTLEEASDGVPTVTSKTRIIYLAIASLGALIIAAIGVFIKFDYSSEK